MPPSELQGASLDLSEQFWSQIPIREVAAGIIGGTIAAAAGWVKSRWNRPNLQIDFKEHNNKKPYVDQQSGTNAFYSPTSKLLRLVVTNKGKSPANTCEAKLTWERNGVGQPFQVILHWVRRDPLVFEKIDDLFTPITVNAHDEEELDVLRLRSSMKEIESVSHRIANIEKDVKYKLKVTAFSASCPPTTRCFELLWDGTWDSFEKSIVGEKFCAC